MSLTQLKAILEERHYPALPPAHPAFIPILRVLAEAIPLKGVDFAAKLCESTGRAFDKIIHEGTHHDLVQVGGHAVEMRDIIEMSDWLFIRTEELRNGGRY